MLFLPRWLDDELHGRGWAVAGIGVLALVAFVTVVGLWWSRPNAPSPPPPVAVPLPKPLAKAEAPAAVPPVALQREPAIASMTGPTTCPHQQLRLALPGQVPLRACVAATRMTQHGGVRTYALEPEGLSEWTLHIDAAGGAVMRVRLSDRRGALYACEEAECAGFSIGRPDRYGVRAIGVREALLRSTGARPAVPVAASAAPSPGDDTMVLNASLAAAPDSHDPRSACAVASVAIVESTGAVDEICPGGGAGVEFLPEGARRYSFEDHEGRHLAVTVAAGGSIHEVALDGANRCESTSCGGITMQVEGDAGDPLAQRTFAFSGTVLSMRVPSRHTATLSGSITMPRQ